jgi:alcohol dehydrogenase
MLKETDVNQIVHRTIDQMNALAIKAFCVPPDTHIGPGAITRIGEALHRRGITRVFVVVDEIVEQLGLAAGMYRAFDAYGIDATVRRQPPGEPCSDAVEEAAKALSATRVEGVVALGGGSVIDAAKVTAVLAANPDYRVADLVEPDRPWRRRLPFIAVPTTAGTGSEATNVSVITDAGSRRHKRVIAHTDLMPDLALIDACLTLDVPPRFTAMTGIDALTHAIEAYVATNATPLTRALAHQAMRMIGNALPIAVGKGNDVTAREEMILASYMAGIAFSNAGLGLCHATAHRIGPAYGLPHGLANAVMLPSVMRFNALVCKKPYADIGQALSGTIMNVEETIRHIQALIVEVGLPENLAAAGGKAADFEAFADEALSDVCIESNPRAVSREQIIGVYQHAWSR